MNDKNQVILQNTTLILVNYYFFIFFIIIKSSIRINNVSFSSQLLYLKRQESESEYSEDLKNCLEN